MNLSLFIKIKNIENASNIFEANPQFYHILSDQDEYSFTEGEIIRRNGELYISVAFFKNTVEDITDIYVDLSEKDIENISVNIIRKDDVLEIRQGIKSELINDEIIEWFDTGEYYNAWMYKAGDPKREDLEEYDLEEDDDEE